MRRRPEEGEEPGGEQEGRERLGQQQRLVLDHGRVCRQQRGPDQAGERPGEPPAQQEDDRDCGSRDYGQHDQGERQVDPAADQIDAGEEERQARRVGAARLDLMLDSRRAGVEGPVAIEVLGDPCVGVGVGWLLVWPLRRVPDPQSEAGGGDHRQRDQGRSSSVAGGALHAAMLCARPGRLPLPCRGLCECSYLGAMATSAGRRP